MILAAYSLAMAEAVSPAGFYSPHQIEVGAALQLDEDGKFQYQLDYGAVSEAAEGRWWFDVRTVYLTATSMAGAYRQRNFDREPLQLDGEACCSNGTIR